MEYIIVFLVLIVIVVLIMRIANNNRMNRVQHDNTINQDEILKSIDEFINREKPKQITLKYIEETDEDKIEQGIMDYILDMRIGSDYDKEYFIVTQLPKGLIYLYATWLLEGEVNNGGFNQYFFNSSNQFANEAHKGLLVFGAKEHAEILKYAVDIFIDEKEMQKKMREEGSIESFTDSYKHSKLVKADKKFYNVSENLSELRINYIKSHPEEFVCN